jgi:uncharacterized protein (TIGR02757 family)
MVLEKIKLDKIFFEDIYKKYNKKEFIYSDPIQFPKRFSDKRDIEISALISSSLAYGNVKQIIKSLNYIFSIMNSPLNYIKNSTNSRIIKDFKNFKHRFTDGNEITNLILNLKEVYKNYNSLEDFFIKHIKNYDSNIYPSTNSFLKSFIKYETKTLIPNPDKKSAMKRFNMFLRWLVRKDEIDFGIWTKISPKMLLIPLDTHMHQISLKLKITNRKDTSIKTVFEITDFFRKIEPKDPVKYDFSLVRAPILKNLKN